jgi:hypothetical protein
MDINEQPPSHAAIRDELQDLVLKDLLGPANGPDEEIAEDSVRGRYLVGKLAPRNQVVGQEASEDLASSETDDNQEDGITDPVDVSPDSLFPSSMGLSFTVVPDATAIRVTARWGWYQRIRSETLLTDKGNQRMVWKRTPIDQALPPIPLQNGMSVHKVIPEQPDVLVQARIRQSAHGDWHVSLFLVNRQGKISETGNANDTRWLFQPELIVEAPEGAAIFHRRQPLRKTAAFGAARIAEEQAMQMLYRQQVEFAVGHNVAVHAETHAGDLTRAWQLSTSVVPTHEIPQQTPPNADDNPQLAGLTLDMKALAGMADDELFQTLDVLPLAYAAWIDEQTGKIDAPGR